MSDFLNDIILDNNNFVDKFFSGNLNYVVNVCNKCNHIILTELDNEKNQIEFSTSYCPFCEIEIEINLDTIKFLDNTNTPDNINKKHELTKELNNSDNIDNEQIDNIINIVTTSKTSDYEIVFCESCYNRFLILNDDIQHLGCCAFCGDQTEMISLLAELNKPNYIEHNLGLHNYIGKLFHIKFDNIEGNFVLTNIDINLKLIRLISLDDNRVAIWKNIDDIDEIIEIISE